MSLSTSKTGKNSMWNAGEKNVVSSCSVWQGGEKAEWASLAVAQECAGTKLADFVLPENAILSNVESNVQKPLWKADWRLWKSVLSIEGLSCCSSKHSCKYLHTETGT